MCGPPNTLCPGAVLVYDPLLLTGQTQQTLNHYINIHIHILISTTSDCSCYWSGFVQWVKDCGRLNVLKDTSGGCCISLRVLKDAVRCLRWSNSWYKWGPHQLHPPHTHMPRGSLHTSCPPTCCYQTQQVIQTVEWVTGEFKCLKIRLVY